MWQAGGQAVIQGLGLKQQLAPGLAVAGAVELKTGGDIGTGCTGQCVQRAAGLAGIACDFRHAFLVAIQLLQYDHRQVNVVFLKAKQAHGVVQQHVGVQHKQLGRSGVRHFLGTGGVQGRRCSLGLCDRGNDGRHGCNG